MSHLLGIDLGTSSAKVVITDECGNILGSGSAGYPMLRPRPGWAEQDPNDWWQSTADAVQQAVASGEGAGAHVCAIGVSGQMHGTVLLDAAGAPLSPAVIWPDQRSQRQVVEITDLIGAERLIEITGSPVATGFQAATVRWVQQERPDLWDRTQAVLLPKDHLRFRLTGEMRTDPSDGSGTLLLDVRQRNWSTELLMSLGIDEGLLPPVCPSTAVSGVLTPGAGRALGLPGGIPVITGAADTACSALGAGVVDERSLLLTISTGGQLVLPVMEVLLDGVGRIHTFCNALPPRPGQAGWYQMGAILSAGLALRWLRDQVFGLHGQAGYSRMLASAESAPPGANGLLFLPYLMGERTPHMDPGARGAFLGLTASHGQAELVRAVMEGVALACFDAFQVLVEMGARTERIVMAGGGARSQLWQQIVADVFWLPVHRLKVREQSAVGAALLAGAGMGLLDAGRAARRWAGYHSPVEPEERRHVLYTELLDIFRAVHRAQRDDLARLQALCRHSGVAPECRPPDP